jgi:hypothetical protein
MRGADAASEGQMRRQGLGPPKPYTLNPKPARGSRAGALQIPMPRRRYAPAPMVSSGGSPQLAVQKNGSPQLAVHPTCSSAAMAVHPT